MFATLHPIRYKASRKACSQLGTQRGGLFAGVRVHVAAPIDLLPFPKPSVQHPCMLASPTHPATPSAAGPGFMIILLLRVRAR